MNGTNLAQLAHLALLQSDTVIYRHCTHAKNLALTSFNSTIEEFRVQL